MSSLMHVVYHDVARWQLAPTAVPSHKGLNRLTVTVVAPGVLSPRGLLGILQLLPRPGCIRPSVYWSPGSAQNVSSESTRSRGTDLPDRRFARASEPSITDRDSPDADQRDVAVGL